MTAAHFDELRAAALIDAADPPCALPFESGAAEYEFKRTARRRFRRAGHHALTIWERHRHGDAACLQDAATAQIAALALDQMPRRDRDCLLSCYGMRRSLTEWAASKGIGEHLACRIFCGALSDVGAHILALTAASQSDEFGAAAQTPKLSLAASSGRRQ